MGACVGIEGARRGARLGPPPSLEFHCTEHSCKPEHSCKQRTRLAYHTAASQHWPDAALTSRVEIVPRVSRLQAGTGTVWACGLGITRQIVSKG